MESICGGGLMGFGGFREFVGKAGLGLLLEGEEVVEVWRE